MSLQNRRDTHLTQHVALPGGLNLMDEQKGNQTTHSLLSAWIESAAGFWGSMLQNWTPSSTNDADASPGKKSRTQESFEAVFNSWQTLSSVAQDPGAMEAFSNLGRTMPELLSQMVQASWRSYYYLQQQWVERAGRIGESTRAFTFENLDEDVFKAWTDIYENECQQFFHIPQLGLTRNYQQNFFTALDKYHRFQAQYAEFMNLIILPVEKTFKVLQQQLTDLAREGKLPENSNDYYKLFIKILEGHYMSLFKSPEYITAMSKTLEVLEDFVAARDTITQDILNTLSMPNQKDLDELYKELYHLKKRLKILEKEKSGSQGKVHKS
jgi:hypothetical protein